MADNENTKIKTQFITLNDLNSVYKLLKRQIDTKVTKSSILSNQDWGEIKSLEVQDLKVTNLQIKDGADWRSLNLSGGTDNKIVYAGNDYVDFIEINKESKRPEFGKCYILGDDNSCIETTRYGQKGTCVIHSDTYGATIGSSSVRHINAAVGGIVLAHTDKEYETGTPLTCGKDGKLTKMGLFLRLIHPERLVATYYRTERSKHYNNIDTLGRNWVKVR